VSCDPTSTIVALSVICEPSGFGPAGTSIVTELGATLETTVLVPAVATPPSSSVSVTLIG
jgi:hypothetical protein